MGQATDQGFSNSMLSPVGVMPFLLVEIFLELLCFGVGVAPCLRPSTGRSWGSSLYFCDLYTLTGSAFVDADKL